MAVGEFAARYLSVLDDLGQPADPSHRWVGSIPVWLPPSLRELYRVAGNHPLNRVHHRLLPPDELERDDMRVVFVEENQQVVVWAFDTHDRAADPLVWQGQPDPDEATGFVWYPEDRSLSEFMISMWKWILTGE